MRRTLSFISFLVILTMLAVSVHLSYSYWLHIVVSTDKTVYNVGETIHINGTLQLDGVPVSSALVAIQINDRHQPFSFRTVNTGTDPLGPFKVEMINAYTGDQYGNPVSSVRRGLSYLIWIVYRNNDPAPVRATMTYTICNMNSAPLAASVIAVVDVPPGLSNSSYNWQVPTDAELGTYAIYGNAYTDLPQYDGAAYSPEKSSQFAISATSTFEHSVQTAPGDYYCNASTFKTVYTRLGNYTVHAVAEYWGIIAHESTTFEVKLLGDVNGDNYVNAKDAVILGKAFGTQEGDPLYNAGADINKDGFCNAKDAITIGKNFGNSGY